MEVLMLKVAGKLPVLLARAAMGDPVSIAILAAAGADAIGGIIPGLAVPATIASCFGAVWVMYARLSDQLGIKLSENVAQLLAKAALANIGANLGGALLPAFAGMFIPGASILASAGVAFATVYLAGQIFLNLILNMAKKSSDRFSFSDMSAEEMESEVQNIHISRDDLKAAKRVYQENR